MTRVLRLALVLCTLTGSRAWAGELELRGPDKPERGKPFDLGLRSPPGVKLIASAGEIAEPVAAGPGRLRARYTPPATRHPQLVVIAAYAESGRVLDFTTVPLHGEARLEVDSDPNVEVRGRIGGVESAPVRTDAKGHAVLELVVPPGVEAFELVARGARGPLATRRIPLELPPVPRALAICAPSGDRVAVVALDKRGAPATGQLEVELKPAGVARVRAVEIKGGGVFEVGIEPEADAPLGAVVAAWVRMAGDPLAASCTVPGADPTAFAVTLDRPARDAGVDAPVKVTITPSWPPGRLRRAPEVELEPSLGTTTPVRVLPGGTLEAEWRVPSVFGGARQAELKLRPRRASLSPVRAGLELRPGAPVRMSVIAPGPLSADGRSGGYILARLLDAQGNEVPPGVRVRYQAPLLREPRGRPDRGITQQSLKVSDAPSGVAASVPVTLHRGPRRWEAGVSVGYLSNFARVSAGVVIASLRARLPLWGERPFVAIDVGFHGGDGQAVSPDPDDPIAIAVRAVPLRARVGWEFRTPFVRPYLAFGVGAAWSETTLTSQRLGRVVSDGWTWLVSGALGAAMRAGPGRLGVELAYAHAPINREGVSGNVAGLSLTAGYAVDFE
jgi:hypothetical protein